MKPDYHTPVRSTIDGPEKPKPNLSFCWMFDWAHPLNEALKPLTERDQLTFLKKFLENWRAFNRGPSGTHIFPAITEDREALFLAIVDDSLKPYLGMRLMFTMVHIKEGQAELRCWYGIPLEFTQFGAESDRKGLLFTIKGGDEEVGRYFDSLLTDEEKGSRLPIGNLRAFVFGLIQNRVRPQRSPILEKLE